MSEPLSNEPQLPPQKPAWSFDTLRNEVQEDLLAYDGVFYLVRDALLTHDDDRLPQFTLDVAYSTVDPALFAAEEDPARYIGAKIRIGYKARHVEERLAELAFGLSSFDYLNIGYVRTDGTDIKIFDDEGRLHTFPKDEDGAIMLDAQLISAERVDAVRAWQAGHNKLLRTSREHPELHIDPMTMVWTDRQVNYMAAE